MIPQHKETSQCRESWDDSGTGCGTVCDQHMAWERKSCEIEINGHITAIAWGRQEYEQKGCETAQQYSYQAIYC